MSITYHTQLSEILQVSLEERIGQQLRRMDIPGKLKGHRYLVDAIKRVTDDPQRLDYITRDLYLDIAKQYGTTGGKVERAMRTAIRRCREKRGRGALEEMTGFRLQRRQGEGTDSTSATPLQKLNIGSTRELLAQKLGESHEQIRKYVRLTNLIPEILAMVDNSVLKVPEKLQMALRPAVQTEADRGTVLLSWLPRTTRAGFNTHSAFLLGRP